MSALRSKAAAQGEELPSSQDAKGAIGAGNPTADGLKLLRAFLNIRDATLRRSVVHLVELLAAPRAKG
ncbi:MAG TPA: hypothetical protein VFK79_02300 [Xanthobacteraceae bacterium]|nr:hypothetical protein [Xanthobacteraceae bacterium]